MTTPRAEAPQEHRLKGGAIFEVLVWGRTVVSAVSLDIILSWFSQPGTRCVHTCVHMQVHTSHTYTCEGERNYLGTLSLVYFNKETFYSPV